MEIYSQLLMTCGIPPQVAAEMSIEQQLGVFMGLRLTQSEDIASFQSVREMNQFLMGSR